MYFIYDLNSSDVQNISNVKMNKTLFFCSLCSKLFFIEIMFV